MKSGLLFFVSLVTLFCSSCSQKYLTPGRVANLSVFTDPSIKKAYTARPAIRMPANIAIVRVQDSGYRSHSADSKGVGAYSVVSGRDLETDKDHETLSELQGIDQIVPINRLLLPENLGSDLDLRVAAARLQTDAILLYTLDTKISDSEILAPLTLFSLGLAPNKTYKITSTASALLMDTKTGYVYGALEEVGTRSGITMPWGSGNAFDAVRKRTEREAMDKLVTNFGPFWNRIYSRYK